ncbi:MAG: hypothetical protein SO152_01770 [Ruminococcus sp.]|nr:hypothetical protein [Ruminococcus sp.]
MVDNERMDKLVRSFFEDHDHGREAMQNASVTENICFIDYLENTCIKKAKEMNNEDDMQYFTEYDIHFRMLTLEKIMKLEELWIVISKATNHFYAFNHDVIVLVDPSEADYLINNLAKQGLDVEIRKISGSDFVAMVEDMPRLGFTNVEFTDGRLRPLIIPRDTILKADKTKTRTNPTLYIESLIFLQQVAKYKKEGKGVIVKEDSPLTKALQESVVLVPAIVQNKQSNQMQVKYPFLNTGEAGQKVLPVLTDRKEYEYFLSTPLMKDYASLPEDKRVCIELPFMEVYRIFSTDDLFAVSVNPMGFNLVVNKDVMGIVTKEMHLTNNPNILVEKNGQPVEFPEEQPDEAEEESDRTEDTDVLRRKVLEHFIETQEGIIEKNKDIDTEEAKSKVKKAEEKLKEFKKQLEALNE